MSSILPAWSEPFHAQPVAPAPHLRLPATPTKVWAQGDGRGAGVRVAIIDTGIRAEHPLVGGVAEFLAVERDATKETGVRLVEGPHDDLYGHGTACASIIRGLAPDVELISVRVLGANLKGSALSFAYGLEWCIEHDVQVVNLSLSTSNEDYLETFWDLLDQAVFRRVMLVSAMNNEPRRTIPSELSGVFSVACTPGTDRERIMCNPDGPAEWGAPGVDVSVAWTEGTLTATGNSFAAPVIAGHLARIVATHPGITPWQARTVLAAIADNAPV